VTNAKVHLRLDAIALPPSSHMAEPPSLETRIKGAIYGLAVCDALGAPVEFKRRRSFQQVTSMLPNDNFNLPAGCFTDDTSMTLCLAHSLLDSDGCYDVVDQVKRYLAWSRDGYMSSTGYCFDIGVSTTLALNFWADMLESEVQTSAVKSAAILEEIKKHLAKEEYCGNGSLMRALPTALIPSQQSEIIELARQSSLPTHPHPRCVHACIYYATLVHQALQGASKAALARYAYDSIGQNSSAIFGTAVDSVLGDRLGEYKSLEDWLAVPANAIQSTGYVVDTIEAALWAFFTSDTFKDAAIQAVNLGDDADTVGAICGGLAGAYYGFDAIPELWLHEMKKLELVNEVAHKLTNFRAAKG
jgi:ADP-ribosyl-[dinitrogen reductase] hydrolase